MLWCVQKNFWLDRYWFKRSTRGKTPAAINVRIAALFCRISVWVCHLSSLKLLLLVKVKGVPMIGIVHLEPDVIFTRIAALEVCCQHPFQKGIFCWSRAKLSHLCATNVSMSHSVWKCSGWVTASSSVSGYCKVDLDCDASFKCISDICEPGEVSLLLIVPLQIFYLYD